eukprot:TRINITY_DN46222_c0_g1_i1.p1 TRINITY_DN46222_c0_g1~~TRINITY_DN46222_c0_g1_i1.p1  ORF type:complete len:481 (-),score=33.65 TRINITY_DN46222_c0_g1_i1:43-1434(-)
MTKRNKAIRVNNEGNTLYKTHQYREAITCYSQAIQIYPEMSAFYGNRGQAYYQLKDFQRSIEDSLAAVRLDPAFWKGYVRAGKAYIKLGNFPEARQCFEAVKSSCQDVKDAVQVAQFELARCDVVEREFLAAKALFKKKNWSKCISAIESLESVAGLKNLDLKLMQCECLYQKGQYNAVKNILEAVRDEARTLSNEERQRVNIMDLKAFAAQTAASWKNSDRKKTLQANDKDGGGGVAMDLYAVLGIPNDSNEDVISSAYNRLALRCKHQMNKPDTFLSDAEQDELKQKYLDVTQAFLILGDAEKRELYDLGWTDDEIMDDTIKPAVVFCGLPHKDSGDFRKCQYCMKHAAFWACSPCIGVSALACCWGPWCLKRKCTEDGEDARLEARQHCLKKQRDAMLYEGRLSRQQKENTLRQRHRTTMQGFPPNNHTTHTTTATTSQPHSNEPTSSAGVGDATPGDPG